VFREIFTMLYDPHLDAQIEEYQRGEGPCFQSPQRVQQQQQSKAASKPTTHDDYEDFDDIETNRHGSGSGGGGALMQEANTRDCGHTHTTKRAAAVDLQRVYVGFRSLAAGVAGYVSIICVSLSWLMHFYVGLQRIAKAWEHLVALHTIADTSHILGRHRRMRPVEDDGDQSLERSVCLLRHSIQAIRSGTAIELAVLSGLQFGSSVHSEHLFVDHHTGGLCMRSAAEVRAGRDVDELCGSDEPKWWHWDRSRRDEECKP
jgi:hypothetical protein